MKNFAIIRMVAIFFITITSVLLILTIFDVVSSEETKDLVIKLAATSGVVALTAMVVSLLGDSKK